MGRVTSLNTLFGSDHSSSQSQISDRMAMAAMKQLPGMARVYAAPRWATFVKYGKVELMPPSPAEIPAAIGELAGLVKSGMTMQWRHTPVKEAFINAVVTTEVLCWFFIGECIGKGSLVAYKV